MNYTRTKYLIVLLSIIYLCLPILGKSIPERDVDLIKRSDEHVDDNGGGDDDSGNEDELVDPEKEEEPEPEPEPEPEVSEPPNPCDDGQPALTECNDQKKNCINTPDDEEKYKCEGCQDGFGPDGEGNCVHVCTEGQAGFAACKEQNRTCIPAESTEGYECDKCVDGFVENLKEKKCVGNPCMEGEIGNLSCTAQNMKCVADSRTPFFKCGDCLAGFDLAGKVCVDFCNVTKDGDRDCSIKRRLCKPTKADPYYECGKCLNNLVNNGELCVDPCKEDQIGGQDCKAKHRMCKFDSAHNYTCGECENGPYIEVKGACVDGCAVKVKEGEEDTWEKFCSKDKTAKCGQNKNKTAVTCHCDDPAHLFNLEKKVCSAPCDKENGLGYSECNKKGRECEDIGEGKYQCGVCTDKKLIVHENVCVEPCAENKPGSEHCQSINRTCVSNEAIEEKYYCGVCIANHIEKEGDCIDPCEEIAKDGKKWSQQCQDTKGKCIPNDDESGATCKCDESDKIFDLKNKECSVPCELYKDDNDTWTKICNDANADCENDLQNKKGICKCREANRAFDEEAYKCFDPCANGTKGFTSCTDVMMKECLFKENKPNFYECGGCIDGYHEKDGKCVEIDPCDSSPCQNEGICTRIDRDKYNCKCTEYWYGDNCEHKEWCKDKDKNPCKAGVCELDKDHDTYTCICEGEQYYDHTKGACEALNKCAGITCKRFEECVEGNCTCVKGFEKPKGEDECKMTTEECIRYCGENAKCSIASNFIDVECSCDDGYYLDPDSSKCETKKCVTPFHPCEQKCVIKEGNETCGCDSGFELKSDEKSCELKKGSECIGTKTPCANGVCVKKGDNEECNCNKGYFKDTEGNCVDICGNENSGIKKLCPDGCLRDEKGEIKCNCTGIYVQAEDGVSCKRKNFCEKGEEGEKECSSLNANCKALDADPWYKCECPPHLLNIGGNCSDSCSSEKVNECAETMRTCEVRKSTSANQLVEACVCPLSMVYDNTANKCHFDKNSFFVTFVMKSPISQTKMAQAPPNVDTKSIYEAMVTIYGESLTGFDTVECSSKDKNLECTVMLTLKDDIGNIRRRILLNETCKDLPADGDKEYCILPPRLVVLRASLSNNKLTKEVCSEKLRDKYCPTVSNDCTDQEPGYTCLCKKGFKPVTTFILGGENKYKYETCEDVNECAENNPCWENSKCENTIGSFRCVCNKNHFLTESKDKCQDYCKPTPCKNGECKYSESSFQCECSKGFTGALCENKDEFLQKANTNMIVIGAVLGSVLLISVIIIIVLIGKVKKRSKEEEEYDAQMDDYGRNLGNGKGLGDRERAVRRERLGKQGYDNPAM